MADALPISIDLDNYTAFSSCIMTHCISDIHGKSLHSITYKEVNSTICAMIHRQL